MQDTTTALAGPDAEAWNRALDVALLDTDSLTDELAAACMASTASPHVLATLARMESSAAPQLHAMRLTMAVPDLFYAVMVGTPDVAMRARALLREWLLAQNSERVARLVWAEQDEQSPEDHKWDAADFANDSRKEAA